MISVQIKDGVVEGETVVIEAVVGGGFVTLVIPKSELDVQATPALKVAKVVEYLKKKVYLPAPVAKTTVTLATTVSVDLSVAPPAPPVIPGGPVVPPVIP